VLSRDGKSLDEYASRLRLTRRRGKDDLMTKKGKTQKRKKGKDPRWKKSSPVSTRTTTSYRIEKGKKAGKKPTADPGREEKSLQSEGIR